MKKLFTVLILAMLVLSMGITLAAEKEDKTPKTSPPQATAGREEEHMKFDKSGDIYVGKFVSFTFKDSTREIENYTFNNTIVFSSINISSFSEVERLKLKGAEVKIDGKEDVEIDIHDNPTGLLKIDAEEDATIKLAIGSGMVINQTGNKTITLNNNYFNGTLMIAGKGKLEVNDSNINATIIDGKLIFRAKPGGDYGERETYREMEKEMEQNHVGAELHIKGKKSFDTVVYTDLNVNITNVDEANKTINVVVSSPTPEGKFIIFNIDTTVLGAIRSGDYKVLIDGKEIQMASNIQDLINAKAKNETSKYLVTIGASGAQVIVYVQKFSEHMITIQGVAPSPVVPGFEALGLVIAIACIALLRRAK